MKRWFFVVVIDKLGQLWDIFSCNKLHKYSMVGETEANGNMGKDMHTKIFFLLFFLLKDMYNTSIPA